MIMEIYGKIIAVLPIKPKDNPNTLRQDCVIQTFDEKPQSIAFLIHGEKRIKKFNVKEGDEVGVVLHFEAIDTVEFNGRWLNIIQASDIYRPLTYQQMGGYGNICCLNCGHIEKGVTSFVHGAMSAEIGRQCPRCGKFFEEHNESQEHHTFGEAKEDCICPECGQLVRKKSDSIFKGNDVPLFCPKCKSYHLKYYMDFIT